MLGASLLCPSNAFASVRMYVIWQPVQNGGWERADGGSTIGGVFHVRVVVQPNSGYLYGGASVISNLVTELADHHAGQTTMGNFAQVSPNSSYGDPTSNVSVLQSEPLFLPHNATYRLWVRVQYMTYYSMPPYPLIPNVEEQEIQVTMNNLKVIDSRSEQWFVWDAQTMSSVPFSVQLQHAQQGDCTVYLDIYRSDNNQTPIFSAQFPRDGEPAIARPGVWNWSWAGRLADGSVAERGVYVYRIRASTRCGFAVDGDDSRSAYLHTERAADSSGEMILEAEYWGYDDHGTPRDDSDDEHMYFVRWYALRSGRNASTGQIWLFDPSLQRAGVWDVSQLPCVEHDNERDGLRASSEGVRHGVIVRVPVSIMNTPGEYLFMVHMVDDHADLEHWHRRLPALELNARVVMPSIEIYAPDDEREFRRGCLIDIRMNVRYYRLGDVIRLWIDESLKGDIDNPYLVNGRFAKFKYLWDTSHSQRGSHIIRAQVVRTGRPISKPTMQPVPIFALNWPEPGIIWGGFGTEHRGVDIWWSAPYHNTPGFPTKQPIQNAHEGVEYHSEGQAPAGGYRFWVRTRDRIRVDLDGERDGIPVYKERYVWTYYAHLYEHPSVSKREDNSGNAISTESHLHFSVFLTAEPIKPDYNAGTADDPVRWLYPETFYALTGDLTDTAGNPINEAIVQIRGGRVDGEVKTPRNVYRVFIPRGTTVTITPIKTGYRFYPQSVTITVNQDIRQDFVGSTSPP